MKQSDVFSQERIMSSPGGDISMLSVELYKGYFKRNPYQYSRPGLNDSLDLVVAENTAKEVVEKYLTQHLQPMDEQGLAKAIECEFSKSSNVLAGGGRNALGFPQVVNYAQKCVRSKIDNGKLIAKLELTARRTISSYNAAIILTSDVNINNGIATFSNVSYDPSCLQKIEYNQPTPCEIGYFSIKNENIKSALSSVSNVSCVKDNIDKDISFAIDQKLNARFRDGSRTIQADEIILNLDYTTAISRLQRTKKFPLRFDKDTNSFIFEDSKITADAKYSKQNFKVSHQINVYPEKNRSAFIVKTIYDTAYDTFAKSEIVKESVVASKQQQIVNTIKAMMNN